MTTSKKKRKTAQSRSSKPPPPAPRPCWRPGVRRGNGAIYHHLETLGKAVLEVLDRLDRLESQQ